MRRPATRPFLDLRLPLLLTLVAACATPPPRIESTWDAEPDRIWIGSRYWANRLQDWRLREGRAECVGTTLPYRTLHLTTRRVRPEGGTLEASVRLGALHPVDGTRGPAAAEALAPEAAAGLWVGAGAWELDWRAACLVQSAPGPDGGWFCGVTGDGRLVLRDHSQEDPTRVERAVPLEGAARLEDLELSLRVDSDPEGPGDTARLVAVVRGTEGKKLAEVSLRGVADRDLAGNLALVAHSPGKDSPGLWFADWEVAGTRLARYDAQRVGPIVAAFHTLSRGTLKMSAQLLPVGPGDPDLVTLEVEGPDGWSEVAWAPVEEPSYSALLRVDGWSADRDVNYRVVYGDQHYRGTVRHDPLEKDEIVLAALSCNHNNRFGFGRPGYPWNHEALWFPHGDTVRHLRKHDPDLLFFAGDQIYEGASPTPADRGNAELDYLYKWSLFCWAFGDLARDRPAVVIPDDHDVFQGNLWGAGGRSTRRDHFGGYVMPADWVRMVERTQTAHLPDPVDPRPVDQGIGVYFTDLVYGGVGFAVLEDRKFKSGCADLELGGPRPDHVVDASFDPARADVPGKVLLGERQLAFLDAWARDWEGQAMKIALSQTVFAGLATHHGGRQDVLVADLDSNGWPQAGRNRALDALRRGFALHVAGDQHLATLVHHGIDTWDDATWSFTMPAIANFYARAWRPAGPAEVPLEGLPDFAGSRFDGLGNRVTVWAATNPDGPTGREPARLHDQMPGYGIVRLNKGRREYVVECWPRGAEPGADPQYAGWPKTIPQRDCYGRRPEAWLPELLVEGVDQPVIQVLTDTGELVYALRPAGPRFQPWVFALGTYRVRVGDPENDRWRELTLTAYGETHETLRVDLTAASGRSATR